MIPSRLVHAATDGRGIRDVYLNGRLMTNVVYAGIKRGRIRIVIQPIKLDEQKKRILCKTLHGVVEVYFRS